MKENVLDVLMYLFENEMDEENFFLEDQEILKIELVNAGFSSTEVNKAFHWLESLTEQSHLVTAHYPKTTSLRVYCPEEMEKLDVESRGFLLFLEQVGVLDITSRELVIDRVMALEIEEFGLEQLKWIVLMVLFNQSRDDNTFAWMEDLVYDELIIN